MSAVHVLISLFRMWSRQFSSYTFPIVIILSKKIIEEWTEFEEDKKSLKESLQKYNFNLCACCTLDNSARFNNVKPWFRNVEVKESCCRDELQHVFIINSIAIFLFETQFPTGEQLIMPYLWTNLLQLYITMDVDVRVQYVTNSGRKDNEKHSYRIGCPN